MGYSSKRVKKLKFYLKLYNLHSCFTFFLSVESILTTSEKAKQFYCSISSKCHFNISVK